MTTYSTINKNTASYSEVDGLGNFTWLLTDALDYILVGSSEDLVLIIQDDTQFGTLSKASTSFSTINKN